MRPIIHIENNNIYFVFQDGSVAQNKDSDRDTIRTIVYKNIDDNVLANNLINIINNNSQIIQNNERYKKFTASFVSYISDLSDSQGKTYYLNVFIIPKEFDIKLDKKQSTLENIKWIEKFTLSVFSCYAKEIEPDSSNFNIFKSEKGTSLIELESKEYIKILKNIHNELFNLEQNEKTIDIVSSKKIGRINHAKNRKNGTPLKIHQKIKTQAESDVVSLVLSALNIFENRFLNLLKETQHYSLIKKIILDIKNQAAFIDDSVDIVELDKNKHFKTELESFFNHFQNCDEVVNNYSIFNAVYQLFYNSIKTSNIVFKIIDISRFLENRLTRELQEKFGDKTWIGCENKKQCFNAENKTKLKKVYFSNGRKKMQCLPDNLIGDEKCITHIYDAKYYTLKKLDAATELFLKMYGYGKAFEDNINNQKQQLKELAFVIPDVFKIEIKNNLPNISLVDINESNFKQIDEYDILDRYVNIYSLMIFKKEQKN